MKLVACTTALAALAFAQPALAQEEPAPDAVAEAEPITDLSDDDTWDDGAWDGEDDYEDGNEAEGEMDAMAAAMIGAMLGSMFQADPLTPAAEARLPAASSVAASLVPEGVYGEMMGQMMDSFLSPLLEMAEMDGGAMSADDLTAYTGLYGEDLADLSQEERAELTGIFDPVYETRSRAQFDMIVGAANSIFAILEPGVRDGLAKAYASRFEESELAQLQTFFATPVGAKFASQNLLINADPQVVSGMMQSIPVLLEELPMLIAGFEDAESGLPEPRRYDDLTPSEQRRAAAILDIDELTLRDSMAAAQEMEDAVADAAAEVEMATEEVEEEEMEESAEEAESFEEAMEDVGAQ